MANCCILVALSNYYHKAINKILDIYQNFILLSKSHGNTNVLTVHLLVQLPPRVEVRFMVGICLLSGISILEIKNLSSFS